MAIDMFVVATATFRLLYTVIVVCTENLNANVMMVKPAKHRT